MTSLLRRKNKTFSLLALAVMIAGLLSGIYLAGRSQLNWSRATVNGPVLTLIPATKTLAAGETASFAVTLNTKDDNVSAVKLEISYDTSALENVTFTPGTILPVVLVSPSVSGGKIKTSLGAQPTSPYQGTGILGTLSVKAKSAKNSSLAFTSETKVYSIGKTGSSLASATGAQITRPGSDVTPTPTPTRTPTPTPTPAGGGGSIDCNTCFQFKNVPILITCVNLCRDIKAGRAQCPRVCNTVPPDWKTQCLNTLCK